MKRLYYIKTAIVTGASTKLPPELLEGGMSNTEREYLDRQADIIRSKLKNDPTYGEEIPSEVQRREKNEAIFKLRKQQVKAKREAMTQSNKLSPEAYTLQLRERTHAATVNMDNTLFHIYKLMDERIPVLSESTDEERAVLAETRRKRVADLYDENEKAESTQDRKPPEPVTKTVNIDPVSFSKRQQRRT